MDSESIVQTINAALSSALGNVTNKAIEDGYNRLKELLRGAVGADSPSLKSLENIEKGRGGAEDFSTLKEYIEKSKLTEDPIIQLRVSELQSLLGESNSTSEKSYQKQVNAEQMSVGIQGDNAVVHGGMHFGGNGKK